MTPEMQATLDAFLAYYEEHRIAPTVRELADILGLKSKGGTSHRLNELVKRGHLIRSPSSKPQAARNLMPVGNDLRAVPTTDLRAELARREAPHG